MYRYSPLDQTLVDERVAQFRDQVARWKAGDLTEDEFRPLRLQNGLYVQRHAPMLRVAIPYGVVSSKQLRTLAFISRRWDRGFGHFTTRQDIQFNWLAIEDAPDILAELAKVQMHALQTSGNCVRNITSDPWAGVAADEAVDPRPFCELLRQWSSLHPEFAFLPRKFKIALTGSRAADRAAVAVHDIGFLLRRLESGEIVADVVAGGGLGRTPVVGTVIREGLAWRHILSYSEAVLRVYNRHGRRDNMYKARIKILLRALGAEEFTRQVDEDFSFLEDGPHTIPQEELDRVRAAFPEPAYDPLAAEPAALRAALATSPAFARWYGRSVRGHRVPGYAVVTLSLKRAGIPPGDADAATLEAIAGLADEFSFGEARVAHEQNIVLADVPEHRLFDLWAKARTLGLATPNIGLLTDMICCPGGDLCALANAKSLPIAEALHQRFEDLDYLHDLGEVSLNISGCINSCGHHHVANIGILGVDKQGEDFFQVTLGGNVGLGPTGTRIGAVIGRSFASAEIPGVVATLLDIYVAMRDPGESFLEVFERIGPAPFQSAVYPVSDASVAPAHV